MAIQDIASNSLPPASQGQMLGFIEPDAARELLTLKMYFFIMEGIRIEDERRGNLFLKRMLDGPQEIWKEIQAKIFDLKTLNDLANVEDRFLQFVKNIVGWTSELDNITDPLTSDSLRKLIGASIPLWRSRGPEDSILSILLLVTGARNRIWSWFDFRFIFEEVSLEEVHQGRDPFVINLPGPPNNEEYLSNLRIVDDGTLDRELAENLVKLMRATGERIDVSYIDFLDLFTTDDDDFQWITPPFSGTHTVANGLIALSVDAIILTSRADAPDWTDYVSYTRVRGDSGASVAGSGAFGLVSYAGVDPDLDSLQVGLDTTNNEIRVFSVVGGVTELDTGIDFTPFGTLVADVFFGLRVEVIEDGGSTRVKVFVDGTLVFSDLVTTNGKGNIGFFTGTLADDVEFDEIEMFQVPLDTVLIDINS